MPDDGLILPDPRSSVALIERVVVIEQQQKQLASDTSAIRSTLYDIKNELQKLVIQEYQRKGAKGAVSLIGTLMLGAVTVGGALMSALLWVTGHLGGR